MNNDVVCCFNGMDHQKATKNQFFNVNSLPLYCILFGTMSENFRKIVRIVFELSVLMWGWWGCGTSKYVDKRKYMQREFQKKLSTLSKACDVTWPEKCKQTSADSLISSVPFVLNIYKKCNI